MESNIDEPLLVAVELEDGTGDVVVVDASLDPSGGILNPGLFDPKLALEDNPKVAIVRFMFMILSLQFLATLIVGYILFQTDFLTIFPLLPNSGSVSGVSSDARRLIRSLEFLMFLCFTFFLIFVYSLLACFRDTWARWVFLPIILVANCCYVGILALMLGDLAPIQYTLMMFLASMSIVGYTLVNPKSPTLLSMRVCGFITSMSCVVGWLVGIYIYIEQQDWIVGLFTLLIGLLSCVYFVFQVNQTLHCDADRYRYNQNNKLESVVNFYSDPLYLIGEWVQERIKRATESGRQIIEQEQEEEDRATL